MHGLEREVYVDFLGLLARVGLAAQANAKAMQPSIEPRHGDRPNRQMVYLYGLAASAVKAPPPDGIVRLADARRPDLG